MARLTRPTDTVASEFSIDLSEVDMTEDEVSSLQNQITKLVFDSVRKKGGATTKKKEPYVKIVHVKSIPKPPIKK